MVERILQLIKEQRLNPSTVEKQLGFGNGSIKRFNTNSPSIDKIIKLSNFLNVPIEYIINGTVSNISIDQQELLDLYSQLDPIKQAEFKGELKGYLKAKNVPPNTN